MKRLLATIIIASATVGVAPAQADDPSVSSRVRDSGQVYGFFQLDNGFVDLFFRYERRTTPAPAVDPGSVFPITIDPNDPPAVPANAVTEEVTLDGYASICEWSTGCWGTYLSQDSVPAGFLSFDDAPLPGNAITVSGTLTLDDGPVPVEVTIQMRGARPAVTRLWTDNTIMHPNVWADGSEVHAGTDTYVPLLTRHTYSTTGSATSMFGSSPLGNGGFDFNRTVEAFTSADATLPS